MNSSQWTLNPCSSNAPSAQVLCMSTASGSVFHEHPIWQRRDVLVEYVLVAAEEAIMFPPEMSKEATVGRYLHELCKLVKGDHGKCQKAAAAKLSWPVRPPHQFIFFRLELRDLQHAQHTAHCILAGMFQYT